MAKPSNELIVVEKIAAGEVFTSSDKVEALLKSVEDQALAVPADVTTEKGRAAIASLAHKVARSKTALEEMGKEFAGVVAESRRTIKDRLDALKVKVRQPLTDWESSDGKRRAVHEAALAEIAENGVVLMPAPSRVIQARIDWLTELPARDWEEFAERAEVLIKATGQALLIHLAAAVHLETERAELDRLRQEAAERAEKERQTEVARRDAEARAEREIASRKAQLAAEAAQSALNNRPTGGPIDIIESGEVDEEHSDLVPSVETGVTVAGAAGPVGSSIDLIASLIAPLIAAQWPARDIAETVVEAIALGKIPNIRTIY